MITKNQLRELLVSANKPEPWGGPDPDAVLAPIIETLKEAVLSWIGEVEAQTVRRRAVLMDLANELAPAAVAVLELARGYYDDPDFDVTYNAACSALSHEERAARDVISQTMADISRTNHEKTHKLYDVLRQLDMSSEVGDIYHVLRHFVLEAGCTAYYLPYDESPFGITQRLGRVLLSKQDQEYLDDRPYLWGDKFCHEI